MDSDNSGPCPQCPVCPTCEGIGIILPHMEVVQAATVAEYEAKLADVSVALDGVLATLAFRPKPETVNALNTLVKVIYTARTPSPEGK